MIVDDSRTVFFKARYKLIDICLAILSLQKTRFEYRHSQLMGLVSFLFGYSASNSLGF